jgi:hypothetical protein
LEEQLKMQVERFRPDPLGLETVLRELRSKNKKKKHKQEVDT